MDVPMCQNKLGFAVETIGPQGRQAGRLVALLLQVKSTWDPGLWTDFSGKDPERGTCWL